MARQIISKIENNTLIINVGGNGEFRVSGGDLTAEVREMAMLHGLKQKICDSAALPNGATLTEKYEAMRETFDRITSPDGTWNKQVEGSGQPTGLLFKALCRKYPGKAPDALRAWLDKQNKVFQAALRKNPEIASIIETIKAESIKTSGVDSADLLSELDGI